MPGQWQLSVNQDQRVGLSDTETFQINLSKSNFTSEIQLKIAVTNGATSNTAAAPPTVIDGTTRIEILANGGDVKNYRGYECEKWAHFLRGTKPGYQRTQLGGGVQEQLFPILFGRFFGDELAMLPSKLYKTLVLKVQTTYPISATAGFATLTEKEDVYELEYVSEDDPAGKIILRELEVQQYTTVASGATRTPNGGLPIGNLITKVLLHEYQAGSEDGTDITYVRLGINNFSEIPIGLTKWKNLQDDNKLHYALQNDVYAAPLTIATATGMATRLSRLQTLELTNGTGSSALSITSIAGDKITFAYTGASTPNYAFAQSTVGVSFCVLLDVDPLKNFSGGIKSSNVNTVDLEVTNGNAGGLMLVSMQEAITVPLKSGG